MFPDKLEVKLVLATESQSKTIMSAGGIKIKPLIESELVAHSGQKPDSFIFPLAPLPTTALTITSNGENEKDAAGTPPNSTDAISTGSTNKIVTVSPVVALAGLKDLIKRLVSPVGLVVFCVFLVWENAIVLIEMPRKKSKDFKIRRWVCVSEDNNTNYFCLRISNV